MPLYVANPVPFHVVFLGDHKLCHANNLWDTEVLAYASKRKDIFTGMRKV